jgi:two-component system OmpR family sensor kinase
LFNGFSSLRSKINLVFSITILLLAILFISSVKYDHAKFEEHNEAHERVISHYIYDYYRQTQKIDEAYLMAQNMFLIKDKERVVKIESSFKEKGIYKPYAVDTFHLQRIMLINNDRFKLYLENKNKPTFPLKRIAVFTIVFLLLLMLYLWVLRSLKPISVLKNKIKTFSEGNLDIECASDSNDEIGEVANEFNSAVKMIRELTQSRQLFLRAIMHELKTPIAKGRLMSEMLSDEKSKIRLHSVFERLNLLIDEFAKIEQISSNNFELNVNPYKVSDLIEASIDMLMIDNPSRLVSVDINNDYMVKVDFELFSLVIKNLLDNAIKYSPDKHVTIIVNDNELKIVNKGQELAEPIANYFKPFHTSKNSLGLGIYIVKSILDIHKMELHYSHKDENNIFMIK